MAVQYWVGDFFVDLSRNQVTRKEQSQTIAPKALAVLTYLAENQGTVVSYDELFANVWPDTIITPNTLQKCIAQLRKVFGQDSSLESYIKTHAKQGYSLECDVKWCNETEYRAQLERKPDPNTESLDVTVKKLTITDSSPQNEIDNTNVKNETDCADKEQPERSFFTRIAVVLGIITIIVYFIGFSFFTPEQPLKLTPGELRSLTATDHKETSGSYSPDGEYIVFNRYSEDICASNNIWAKNTKTQKETQLTRNMGGYGSHSFSKDGKELIFVKTEHCNQPITQKNCYKLMTLDFEKALKSPQSPTVLLECKNSKITKPTWLNNNNVALLQASSNRWQLISYSLADDKSTVIYSKENGHFVDYDYSAKDDLFALTSIHKDNQSYIEIIKPDGRLLSSHPIDYPTENLSLRFIYPNFSPMTGLLVFSTGRQLFSLSFQGKITNISFPLDEPMGSPIFHPNGKRALMTKGNWDSDIAKISLSQLKTPQVNHTRKANSHLAQSQTEQKITRENNNDSIADPILPVPTIVERSTVQEENAIFQPGGKLIAFKSRRSGEDQIWISGGNGLVQLSHFPIDSYITGMNWSANGNSLLVNVNAKLIQMSLDSNQTAYPFKHRIEQLFQWNSEDGTALVNARIDGIRKFGELNLINSAFKEITDERVNRALKSQDGRLIYTDQLDRFWLQGPVENQLIEPLNGQGSDKGFITKDNVIYGINEELQLWSYDLNQDTFKILGNAPSTVESLTDINQSDILLTIYITAKKEVVELVLE